MQTTYTGIGWLPALKIEKAVLKVSLFSVSTIVYSLIHLSVAEPSELPQIYT